jgi:YidC/Oxa1 family membrane protein insertase
MPAASGWPWPLSIVGLVLAVPAAPLPLSLKQIRAQRRLRLLSRT